MGVLGCPENQPLPAQVQAVSTPLSWPPERTPGPGRARPPSSRPTASLRLVQTPFVNVLPARGAQNPSGRVAWRGTPAGRSAGRSHSAELSGNRSGLDGGAGPGCPGHACGRAGGAQAPAHSGASWRWWGGRTTGGSLQGLCGQQRDKGAGEGPQGGSGHPRMSGLGELVWPSLAGLTPLSCSQVPPSCSSLPLPCPLRCLGGHHQCYPSRARTIYVSRNFCARRPGGRPRDWRSLAHPAPSAPACPP